MSRIAKLPCLISIAFSVHAADLSTFRFETTTRSPYTAAYLGNGFLGLETTPLVTTPAHCFVAGLYDHTPGDVPRLASAPAWNEIGLFNGAHWLKSSASQITGYHQVLDMYDGVLRTSYRWSDAGRNIQIKAETFVSRDNENTAALRLVFTPDFAGEFQIRLPFHNWPPPQRLLLEKIKKLSGPAATDPWLLWYPGHLAVSEPSVEKAAHGLLQSLQAAAPGGGDHLSEAVASHWTFAAQVAPDGIITVKVQPGRAYTIVKFAALSTSSGNTREIARNISRQGWPALLAAWHKLWQSDILVDGDLPLQRTIHSMLFYLLASTRENLPVSTPPMGLSSAGYYGHIFWDADTYLFPALLLLHPELARPMVAFRSRTRPAAVANARANGYQGAMYPWEADSEGRESTPLFAGQNAKYENHVNGDVALAAWQYWLATGDRQWLEHDCWPILRDTADFWLTRAHFNTPRRRYEIDKVVSENESLIGISNDAFTNAVARLNLQLATTAARELHRDANPQWATVAAQLYIPESRSPLLWFPLGLPFSPQQTRATLDHFSHEVQTGRAGAMMGGEFYPILAAELDDKQLIGRLLDPLWKPYLRPPFQVIAETPDNQNTNFITGAGAFLQQFVFGYPGLRLSGTGLEQKFRPVLPPGIHRLTLQNISLRGKLQTLTFPAPR